MKDDISRRSEGKNIADKLLVDGMFHYIASGLSNIYLKSGFAISADECSYSIEDVENLHKCIGMTLVRGTNELNGEELRFLRKELSLTQAQVGKLIGADAQTVARWEKNVNSNKVGERFIRSLYFDSMKDTDNDQLKDFLDRVSELEIVEHRDWMFRQNEDSHDWFRCLAA